MKITRLNIRKTTKPKQTRIYIFPEGESLIENLMQRRSRPHQVYRQEILPEILNALALETNLDADDFKNVKWNQYAGCSTCPCSPGFVVKGILGYEVFVTVEN